MMLNVSKILVDEGTRYDINLSEEMCFTEYRFSGPVSIVAECYASSGIIRVEGKLNFKLSLACDRCGSDLEENYDLDFNEVFSTNKSVESDDIRHIISKQIDLTPVIYENLLMNLPMKHLCNEDCKGLCEKCGANLNEKDCGCDRRYVNPAFESLGKLMKKD